MSYRVCEHRCCDRRFEQFHAHPDEPDSCLACTVDRERQQANLTELAKVRQQLKDRT